MHEFHQRSVPCSCLSVCGVAASPTLTDPSTRSTAVTHCSTVYSHLVHSIYGGPPRFSSEPTANRVRLSAQPYPTMEFHDADTDTDTYILAWILADTSDTRAFLKLFLWQAERHANILATILVSRCRRRRIPAITRTSILDRRMSQAINSTRLYQPPTDTGRCDR